MSKDLPIEAVLKEMREIIGTQVQDIAILKATIAALTSEEEVS